MIHLAAKVHSSRPTKKPKLSDLSTRIDSDTEMEEEGKEEEDNTEGSGEGDGDNDLGDLTARGGF